MEQPVLVLESHSHAPKVEFSQLRLGHPRQKGRTVSAWTGGVRNLESARISKLVAGRRRGGLGPSGASIKKKNGVDLSH